MSNPLGLERNVKTLFFNVPEIWWDGVGIIPFSAACGSNHLTQLNRIRGINVKIGPGVVHANVGQNVTPHNPSLGLFVYHFYIQWAHDVTSQSTTTQTTNKHHHHGDGSARLSSSMDLMIPCHPRGRRPCTCSFWGRCWFFWFVKLM